MRGGQWDGARRLRAPACRGASATRATTPHARDTARCRVLVERTVKEVLPAVTQNKAQITQVITMLTGQLSKKQKELEAFKSKYGIVSQKGGQAAGGGAGGAKSSGVLVGS